MEKIQRRPRLEEEVSDMVSLFHPHLRLTPHWMGERKLINQALDGGTARLLQARVEAGNLKIGVCSLTSDASIRGSVDKNFAPDSLFRINSLGDPKPQLECLQAALQRCRAEQVSILVLPELRVDRRLKRNLTEFLEKQDWNELTRGTGLALVVAGSWHVQHEGAWVNRSCVLNHRGDPVWEHDKLAEFNITKENVGDHSEYQETLGIGENGGKEGIRRGLALQFCDSPAGRLAVAICAGFFHEPLAAVMKASGADIFLVPAMTTDTRPLQSTAEDLVRSQYASTFVANCGTVGKPPNGLSFYRLPKAGKAGITYAAEAELLVFDLNEI